MFFDILNTKLAGVGATGIMIITQSTIFIQGDHIPLDERGDIWRFWSTPDILLSKSHIWW